MKKQKWRQRKYCPVRLSNASILTIKLDSVEKAIIMIIGCEVIEGEIELGKNFRVITAMGPAYYGKITSLQIERQNVRSAKPGQQVGVKLVGWNKARVDDLVECFESPPSKGGGPWKPRSGVIRTVSS